MKSRRKPNKSITYKASFYLVASFYAMLVGWSSICISLIASILRNWSPAAVFQLFIVAFLLVLAWHFFLSISYKLVHSQDGAVRFTSPRRTVSTSAKDIALVELPRIGVGLVRFRLDREKLYLFFGSNRERLREILSLLVSANPDIKFK